jgi:hypothetical protein
MDLVHVLVHGPVAMLSGPKRKDNGDIGSSQLLSTRSSVLLSTCRSSALSSSSIVLLIDLLSQQSQ